ncbi:MAG: hypothetical protein Q7J55_00480, partial [bacterium]|nr:hypothetical protein [bacterium]
RRLIDPLTRKETEKATEKFEVKRFIEDMKRFKQGETIYKPIFDSVTRGRVTIGVDEKKDVVIRNGALTAILGLDKRDEPILTFEGKSDIRHWMGKVEVSTNRDEFGRVVVNIAGSEHIVTQEKLGIITITVGERKIDLKAGEKMDALQIISAKGGFFFVEGILTLYNEELNKEYDDTVFVDADFDVRLERMLKRFEEEVGRKITRAEFIKKRLTLRLTEELPFVLPCRKKARIVPNSQARFESIFFLYKREELPHPEFRPYLEKVGINAKELTQNLKETCIETVKARLREGRFIADTRGTAFKVFFDEGGLVVKVPVNKDNFDYPLAPLFETILKRRLGGLLVPGLILDLSDLKIEVEIDGELKNIGRVLVQNRAEPLKERIEELIARGDLDGAKGLIERYFVLQQAMWRRGVIDTDPKFMEKYGLVIVDGREEVVTMGIDSLSIDPSKYEPAIFESEDVRPNGLPQELGDFYEEERKKHYIDKEKFTAEYFQKGMVELKPVADLSDVEINSRQLRFIERPIRQAKMRFILNQLSRIDKDKGLAQLIWLRLYIQALLTPATPQYELVSQVYEQIITRPSLLKERSIEELVDDLAKPITISAVDKYKLKSELVMGLGLKSSSKTIGPASSPVAGYLFILTGQKSYCFIGIAKNYVEMSEKVFSPYEIKADTEPGRKGNSALEGNIPYFDRKAVEIDRNNAAITYGYEHLLTLFIGNSYSCSVIKGKNRKRGSTVYIAFGRNPNVFPCMLDLYGYNGPVKNIGEDYLLHIRTDSRSSFLGMGVPMGETLYFSLSSFSTLVIFDSLTGKTLWLAISTYSPPYLLIRNLKFFASHFWSSIFFILIPPVYKYTSSSPISQEFSFGASSSSSPVGALVAMTGGLFRVGKQVYYGLPTMDYGLHIVAASPLDSNSLHAKQGRSSSGRGLLSTKPCTIISKGSSSLVDEGISLRGWQDEELKELGIATTLAQQLGVREEYLLYVARVIKRYGYERVKRVVEIINKGSITYLTLGRIELIMKAMDTFGEEGLLNLSYVEKIITSIKGTVTIVPTVLYSSIVAERDNLCLILYPEEKLRFRKNKERQSHIPGCLGYSRFYIRGNTLVVNIIQSDVYGILTDSYKKRLKSWPEVLLGKLEKFTAIQGISRIIITPSTYQLKMQSELPEKIAKRLYDEAAENLGYSMFVTLNETLTLEGYPIDTFHIKRPVSRATLNTGFSSFCKATRSSSPAVDKRPTASPVEPQIANRKSQIADDKSLTIGYKPTAAASPLVLKISSRQLPVEVCSIESTHNAQHPTPNANRSSSPVEIRGERIVQIEKILSEEYRGKKFSSGNIIEKEIETVIGRSRPEAKRYLDDLSKEIKDELVKDGFKVTVLSRVKRAVASWLKINRGDEKYTSIADLTDILGITVIVESDVDVHGAVWHIGKVLKGRFGININANSIDSKDIKLEGGYVIPGQKYHIDKYINVIKLGSNIKAPVAIKALRSPLESRIDSIAIALNVSNPQIRVCPLGEYFSDSQGDLSMAYRLKRGGDYLIKNGDLLIISDNDKKIIPRTILLLHSNKIFNKISFGSSSPVSSENDKVREAIEKNDPDYILAALNKLRKDDGYFDKERVVELMEVCSEEVEKLYKVYTSQACWRATKAVKQLSRKDQKELLGILNERYTSEKYRDIPLPELICSIFLLQSATDSEESKEGNMEFSFSFGEKIYDLIAKKLKWLEGRRAYLVAAEISYWGGGLGPVMVFLLKGITWILKYLKIKD